MKKLKIYKYQAETIEDALRHSARVLDSYKKESCVDRDIMQALGMIRNVLEEDIDEYVERL